MPHLDQSLKKTHSLVGCGEPVNRINPALSDAVRKLTASYI
jgi:hypothetical protein